MYGHDSMDLWDHNQDETLIHLVYECYWRARHNEEPEALRASILSILRENFDEDLAKHVRTQTSPTLTPVESSTSLPKPPRP